MLFCGIDWASRAHEVCVLDQAGQPVARFGLAHTQQGLEAALARLGALCPPEQLAVAIERPDGVLVACLAAAGHPVYPIRPNAFAAARARWGAAGSKDDPGDADKLADMLRTDHHRLRALRAPTQESRELQAISRTRDDQIAAKVAVINQLGALLDAHWPGAKAIFARLDSEIALAFLARHPTPQSAARLGPGRLRAFLVRHSYCGRRMPTELLERLRAAPSAPAHLGEEVLAELVGAHVRLLLRKSR